MALRTVVLALLLANGLYFGWVWLGADESSASAGAARLARQVRPESVRVLGPAEASAALAAAGQAPARNACVEAGPFAPEQIAGAERQLAQLPWGSWQRNSVERPSAYVVYHGPFASVAAAQARRAELALQGIDAEPVTQPADLSPGLALGRYDSRAEAEAMLAAQLARRLPGADSARITTLPGVTEHWLRVETPSAALTSQLAALPSTELAGGFRPCGG
jgi:hypothetical protein